MRRRRIPDFACGFDIAAPPAPLDAIHRRARVQGVRGRRMRSLIAAAAVALLAGFLLDGNGSSVASDTITAAVRSPEPTPAPLVT